MSNDDILLWEGLDRLDKNFDQLTVLYEQLQLVSVDASLPQEDFLSFLDRAIHFAIITKLPPTRRTQDEIKEQGDMWGTLGLENPQIQGTALSSSTVVSIIFLWFISSQRFSFIGALHQSKHESAMGRIFYYGMPHVRLSAC